MGSTTLPGDSGCKVIIVGSGFFGLAAARTYLKVDPSISLTILEADPCLGGTWSRDRVYPTLMVQQPLGAYEYPDTPMIPDDQPQTTGLYGNYIPGTLVCDYLEKFAKQENLLDKIIFNSKVRRVEKIGTLRNPKGWEIYVENGKEDGTPDYVCDKLIVASGQTSDENYPEGLDTSSFTPLTLHSKYIGKNSELLLSDKISTVTVYGGGKSALDAVYLCAHAGKKVQWVIRPDEVSSGLPYFGPGVDAFGQNSNSLISTRWIGKMQPNLYTVGDAFYRFWHSGLNKFGYWLHGFYWRFVSKLTWSAMQYHKSENGKKLIPQMKPEDMVAFWVNCNAGILTQPEIVDWIHEERLIKVHRAIITSLSSDRVTITAPNSNASEPTITEFQTDALVFCTGYQPTAPFFGHNIKLSTEVGVPLPVDKLPAAEEKKWAALGESADAKISALFPRLKTPPPVKLYPRRLSPFRLYRHIVPPEYVRNDDRTLFFLGALGVYNTAILTQLASLWGIAWLVGKLNPLEKQSIEDIEQDIAEQCRWSERRYLNMGTAPIAIHMYDHMAVFDVMMNDLGLNPVRKSGWFAEMFGEYSPKDYRGVVDEWLALNRK
ncbi:hypothetical protein BDZ91DRAFT_678162 [Kalaharituber pfeilii]|nr:hypothetical protein BDZ91DRAFT_678162 [Kalaharituber pfeilii]